MKNYFDFFKALACENRLTLLEYLLDKEGYTSYRELVDVLGRESSVVYKHFRRLEEVGLLETKKNGNKVEGKVRKPKILKKFLEIVGELREGD